MSNEITVKECKDHYWVDLGDGAIYMQRKVPQLASESPLHRHEEVIVGLCKAILKKDSNDQTLREFSMKLLESQEPLDPLFSKVLDENYWDLVEASSHEQNTS